MKLKLVKVTWEDSQLGFQGWKLIDDQPAEKAVFYSVGFIVFENKQLIQLFPHIEKINKGPSGSGDIIIPKSCIIKIKKLK